ncbi:MAG: heavy metal translocating P-type ATPase [Blautia sp.]|nr:heavy metal translocating P-type ATPase [Blautia sp.]
MKCRILHESTGRLRVHVYKYYMTPSQADQLEAFLKGLPFIERAKVDERTGNAVIRFEAGAGQKVRDALASFDFETTEVSIPENSGRELSRTYEDKMFFLVVRRIGSRLLLPAPLRTVVTIIKAVPYIWKGVKSLLKGKISVSILDAASITVSMLRGEFDTAGSVMFLLGIGDIMEEWTHRKSVADLASAMSLNVEKVWVRTADGAEVLTGVDKVAEGDTIIVRRGNMIPLDGTVLQGDAMVNQASITGEPLPAHKQEGSSIYAGTVVEEGEIAVSVRKAAGQGRYDRIVAMIEESEKLKSSSEAKASNLADRLVPWTLGATLLTYLVTGNAARAASILMVDFCCALKLSMPISVLSAMREAGEHHITVKGGKFMESVSEAVTIVFDKTGTLTKASPKLHSVVTFGDYDENEMLRLAACLEEHFPHSIANAVIRAAAERGLDHEEEHTKVEYIVAHGIASTINGQEVRIGSGHFIFEDEGCSVPEGEKELFDSLPDEYSHLYLALGKSLAAVLLIEDPIKDEAREVVEELHALGIERVVMMTGDSERTARAVAAKIGVDAYHAEVLPEDKAGFVREEHTAGRKVIMIGDGINDSPALSESDAGVAISSGAAIAREIADITISEDDLRALITLKKLSDALMKRITRNYRMILSFNSFLILMGVLGIFPSTTTALLHNASTIAISLDSMTNLL